MFRRSIIELRKVRPFLLFVPIYVVYALHNQHEKREISKEEIIHSRILLSHLSTPPTRSIIAETKTENLNNSLTSNNEKKEWHYHHLKNLVYHGGITVLSDVLPAKDIQVWKARLRSAFSMNNDDKSRSTIAINAIHVDDHSKSKSNYSEVVSSRGRLHSHQESPKAQYHDNFLQLIASLPEVQGLVHSYFRHYYGEAEFNNKYYLSQVQFLLARPGSQHQIWHKDNVKPGLTLLIALEDVEENGPTELLRLENVLDEDYFNGNDDNSGVMLGCLKAGDALLYDSRVLHRGRGFGQVHAPSLTSSELKGRDRGRDRDRDRDRDRPVLILRWDALSTPPPGAALIVTNLNGWIGSYRMFVVEVKGMIRWLLQS